MCSLRCCALAVPLLAVAGALFLSTIADGKVWDAWPAWSVSDMPDQTGRVAIVTGPTLGGIGYETALELGRKGAHVILAGRSRGKGEEALAALRRDVPGAKAEFAELDLGSLASVRRFADEFIARDLPLHLLVNNAGIMMNPFTLTPDGFESQFATNHLGHFLLTRLLLPVLERSAPARVVTVSSAAAYFPDMAAFVGRYAPSLVSANATRPLDFAEYLRADHAPDYSPQAAYGRSKLANVLFARALDRRVRGKRVLSNACHPGGIATNLARHMKSDLAGKHGQAFVTALDAFSAQVLLSPSRGAVTQLFLATAPEVESAPIAGAFYRPQALPAKLPPMATEELEEALWALSEELVAPFL